MLDDFVLRLVALTGARADQLKCLLWMYAAVPLSLPIPYLPSPLKHGYSFLLSSFAMVFVLELPGGYAQLLAMVVAAYALCRWADARSCSSTILGPWPWAVTAMTMTHLVGNHLYRYLGNVDNNEVNLRL